MTPTTDAPLQLLLVDDDLVDRMTARRALTQSGLSIEFTEVDDVASARAALAAKRFDVVLCDHYLPGGDGLDVLDQRGELNAFTPFIALTGQGDELLAATLMKRGAADYVPKAQVSPSRLRKCVTDALRMRELEARERSAVDALGRYAGQLRAITEATVRIHAAPTFERMVEVIADEAEKIFSVEAVTVETFDRANASVRAERASEPRAPSSAAPAVSAPLEPRREGRQGSITLVGPARGAFDDTDALLLEQYARVVGVGLENARLLRDSREAIQAREDVMAVVSHDLRSPLGTVTMGVAMLRDSLTRRAGEARAELATLERVERGCKRMLRMLEDLLDVTRIDAGSFRIEPRRTRVVDLLQEAADAAQPQAESIKISVRVEVADPALSLQVDRERVLQALGNLVGNALKVTPRGGIITLSADVIDGFAQVTVRDTGPGVAPEHLPHIFDRYWQGPQGSRGAAGIGLFIVRAIAEAHRGRVEVQSEAGRGSAFSLLFPRDR